MEIQNVSVIGAGTMGSGIAHVFAMAGFSVRVIDLKPEYLEKAMNGISINMDRQIKKGMLTTDQKEKAIQNIQISVDLNQSRDSQLVVEAANENYDLKRSLFAQLDEITDPATLLASNTSSISITEIASATRRPEQVIGMHFMNPVPVMMLVEIIRGLFTSDRTFETIKLLSLKLGKTPVEVNDYPGFISNRVLMPMINEAIFCVMENVATVEAIDTVMKLGMNHPLGPLSLADLIGLDTCLAILEVLHKGLGDDKYRPCPLLKKMVAAGTLGRKTGRGFYNYKNQER